MGITSSQAKFIKDKYLDKVNSNYETAVASMVEEVLIAYGIKFNEKAVVNLRRTSSISTGKLADLDIPILKTTSTGYTLEIGYPLDSAQANYYDYINRGVTGVGGKNAKKKKTSGDYTFKSPYPNKKMALSILLWLKNGRSKSFKDDQTKRLSTIQRKNKKLTVMVNQSNNLKKLAYAISSGIKRDGIMATYYFDKAIEAVFNDDFAEAIGEVIDGVVTLKILNINGNNNS